MELRLGYHRQRTPPVSIKVPIERDKGDKGCSSLEEVDLGALAEALEDHSDFLRWFIDPITGEVLRLVGGHGGCT